MTSCARVNRLRLVLHLLLQLFSATHIAHLPPPRIILEHFGELRVQSAFTQHNGIVARHMARQTKYTQRRRNAQIVEQGAHTQAL